MGKKIQLIVFSIVIVIITVLIYIIRKAIPGILLPFIMAGFIIYIVSPIAARLEKKLSRPLSIIAVYLMTIAAGAFVFMLVVPVMAQNLSGLIKLLPEVLQNLQEMLGFLFSVIEYSGLSIEIKQAAYSGIQNTLGSFTGYLSSAVAEFASLTAKALNFLVKLLIAFVIAFYIMRDKERFKKAALCLFPRKSREWAVGTATEINRIISRFIQGQLIVALIDGTLEAAGLYIAGVRYAPLLGAIGGIMNIIPYFGPFIGSIPAIIVALIDSPVKALWAALVFITVQQIDNNFIAPRILQDKVGLHPVTIIFALIAGSELLGVAGMLLAVPAAAVMKVLFIRIVDAIGA